MFYIFYFCLLSIENVCDSNWFLQADMSYVCSVKNNNETCSSVFLLC